MLLLTQIKSLQAMSHIRAAVSFICMGDAESSSRAVDLIGPVLGVTDPFVGVREKTIALCTYGILLMRQQNLQEARIRLAPVLQITHTYLGNLQLVSLYLTVLGNLALALHETGQAREILRSALTLAKKLNDIPTQNWVLSNMTALYQQTGERVGEMENTTYQSRKADDLQQRLDAARSKIARAKLQVHRLSEHEIKQALAGPSKTIDLDIPESIGLSAPPPMPSPARLMDVDIGRLGKRRL